MGPLGQHQVYKIQVIGRDEREVGQNMFCGIIIEKFPTEEKNRYSVQEARGTAVRMAVIRKQEITRVGEDVEKRSPSALSGNASCYSNGRKQYGGSLKNLK